MKLIQVIDAYVSLQRSLGKRFKTTARLLRQFDREMGCPQIDQVRPEAVATFLRGKGTLSATWVLKYRILSGFYRFAISRGHVDRSPLASVDISDQLQSPRNRKELPSLMTFLRAL